MGESIWCNVQAKFPKTWETGDYNEDGWSPSFMERMNMLDMDLDPFEECDDGGVVWSASGSGNYGLVDDRIADALNWMLEHRVPFRAQSEAKYEYGAECIMYYGAEDRVLYDAVVNNDGEQLMSEAIWRAIDTGVHSWAPTFEAYFHPPTLASADISHLPIHQPDTEEEDT